MRKTVLFFVMFCLFILKGHSQKASKSTQTTNKKIAYYNGELTSREGDSQVVKPLGLYVKVVYNTFFKNYTVVYIDSKGQQAKMIFEYEGLTDDQMASEVSLNKIKYHVVYSPSGFSSLTISFIPEDKKSVTYEITKLIRSQKAIE